MGYAPGGAFAGAPRFVMFFKGGSFHSPRCDPPASTRSRARRSRRSLPHAQRLDRVSRHAHPRRLAQERRLPRGARRRPDRLRHGQRLPLLEERLVLRVHRSRVDRHRDRQRLQGAAGAGGAAVRQPAHRRRRALGRRQRRARPALHLVSQAPGRRRAVRQRHRAGAERRAGLRPADAAGERCCAAKTRTSPPPTTARSRRRCARKQSLLDFRLADIADAKRALGMDSEHAHKLDGLVDGWREVEKANAAELAALEERRRPARAMACPTGAQTDRQRPEQEQPATTCRPCTTR